MTRQSYPSPQVRKQRDDCLVIVMSDTKPLSLSFSLNKNPKIWWSPDVIYDFKKQFPWLEFCSFWKRKSRQWTKHCYANHELQVSTTVNYRYKCDDFRCLSVSCVVSGGCTPLGSPPKSICLYSWQSLKRRFQTMFWWWWWQQRNDKDDNRWKETNRWTTGNTETREKGDSRVFSLFSLLSFQEESSTKFNKLVVKGSTITSLFLFSVSCHLFFVVQSFFASMLSSLFSCSHCSLFFDLVFCKTSSLCPHSFSSSSSFHPYAWFSYVRRSSYTPLNFLTWSSWTLGVILVSVTDEKRSKWISQISFPWIPHTSQVLWNKTHYWSPVVSKHSSLQTIVIWSS